MLLLGLVVLLAGCTGAPAVTAVDTAVTVGSIESVFGNWTGRIGKSPVGRQGDRVDLTIERDGTYRFTVHRTHSILAGSGTLTLVAGELRSESAGGMTTYRLFNREGKRIMKVEVERTSNRYLTELRPRSNR